MKRRFSVFGRSSLRHLKRRAQGRRCRPVLEALESRLLLAQANDTYDAPSAAWFGSIESPTLFGAFADAPISSSNWIVRLKPEVTATIRDVRESWQAFYPPTVLSEGKMPPWMEYQPIQGLGLPGQMLVKSFVSAEQTAADFASLGILASFGPDEMVVGAQVAFSCTNSPTQRCPNDPSFANGSQYGLHNTGQNGGTEKADIHAPEAWALQQGTLADVVTVIDTGIDYTHPDLYQNLWINQAEIPASRKVNLADTDGDSLITFYDLNNALNKGPGKITDINGNGRIDAGDLLAPMTKSGGIDTGSGGWADGVAQEAGDAHVDDLIGWDFVNNDNDPLDDNGHGTHVSGTIGAIGNNGIGIAGVNWRTTLMSLKFLDSYLSGLTSSAIQAINYMTALKTRTSNPVNVVVSNNSWGSGRLDINLREAVKNAGNAGILTVAAAGNGNSQGIGIDIDQSPVYAASLPDDRVISVAATDNRDQLATFSNFGNLTVDIAAPGVDVFSTVPSFISPSGYVTMSGTSMAAPQVSGVAALVFAQHPHATPQEVRQAILQSADDLPVLVAQISSGRRLNAYGALTSDVFAPKAFVAPITNVTSTTADKSKLRLTVTYRDDDSIDAASFDDNDLYVTRSINPDEQHSLPFSNSNVQVKLVSQVQTSAPGVSPVTYDVVYDLLPIDPVDPTDVQFDAKDAGDYTIHVRADQVYNQLAPPLAAADTVLKQRTDRFSFSVQIADPRVAILNTTLDVADSNPGDGKVDGSNCTSPCIPQVSLRAAVIEFNRAAAGTYTIVIPDGQYAINIPDTVAGDEDAALRGDLDIAKPITLLGTGKSTTTIAGAGLSRIFDTLTTGHLILNSLTVSNGKAVGPSNDGQGGIIRNRGSLDADTVQIASGSSTVGGGLWNGANAVARVINTTFLSNTSTGDGGAIWNAGTLTLTHSTLASNRAGSGAFGGGLRNGFTGTATIINSTISSNRALGGSGGGIYNDGDVDLQSSTIAFNGTDDGNGGGSGGGLSNASSQGFFSVFNSIVAKNTADTGVDVVGAFQSQGYNLLGKVDVVIASGFNDKDRFSTSVPLDVGLESLSDNGGPTPTHNLSDGSPALDGGGAKVDLSTLSPDRLALLSQDQRGIARSFDYATPGSTSTDYIDTGAVERADSRIQGSVQADIPGKPALAGVTVYADINSNDQYDPAEPRTITGSDGKYTLSVPAAGTYILKYIVGQDGYSSVGLATIKSDPSFSLIADETVGIPNTSSHFQSVDQVIASDELITVSNAATHAIYSWKATGEIAPLVQPGDITTDGMILAEIGAHQQDGTNVAIIARPVGSAGYKIWIRTPDGRIAPLASPNPDVAFTLGTLPESFLSIVKGVVLFTGTASTSGLFQGSVSSSTIQPYLTIGPSYSVSFVGAPRTLSFSSITDPRADDGGVYVFKGTYTDNVTSATGTGIFQVTRTSLGNVSITQVDGHDAVGGTSIGFGTVSYSKNFLAYTDDFGAGFLRVKLGATSPITYVSGQTRVPNSSATFLHLSGAGGSANFVPDLAHDDGRIIFSSEDSAGGFGIYFAGSSDSNSLVKIIGVGDQLGGKTIQNFRFGRGTSFRNGRFVFRVEFSDGTTAAYVATFGTIEGKTAVVARAKTVAGVDVLFRPAEATISGIVFQDFNGDGVKDDDEPVIPEQTVRIDKNNDGIFEDSITTDVSGVYTFAGLTAQTSYKITVAPFSGSQATSPEGAVWNITPSAGEIKTAANFGFAVFSAGGSSTAKLSGNVMFPPSEIVVDPNNPDAAKLAGTTVYIDKNGNGKLDTTNDPATNEGPGIALSDSGPFTFSGLGNASYQVRVQFPANVSKSIVQVPIASNSLTSSGIRLNGKPVATAVGHFDSPSKTNIVVAMGTLGTLNKQLRVYGNPGGGSLSDTPLQVISLDQPPNALAVGDINGDGWDDIVVSLENQVAIYVNQKSPTAPFANPPSKYGILKTSGSNVVGQPKGIALGQFNADGFLDIAVVDQLSGNVDVLLNATTSSSSPVSFQSPQIIANIGRQPIALVAGKFVGGDANVDLAVVNFGDNNLVLLQGNGNGEFTKTGTPIGTGKQPTSVATADLDGDLKDDLVVTSFEENKVRVLLGSNNGIDSTRTQILSAGTAPESVALTDMDNDGNIDIVVSNGSAAAKHVQLLRNQGQGRFSAPEPVLGSAVLFNPGSAYSIVTADLNGDQANDVLLLSPPCAVQSSAVCGGSGNQVGALTLLNSTVASNLTRSVVMGAADVTGADFELVTWHNFRTPEDATGGVNNLPDGSISPGDALAIINVINTFSGQFQPNIGVSQLKVFFGCLDVVSDGFIAPNDALTIINYINAHPLGSSSGGEGESEPPNPASAEPQTADVSSELLFLLATDLALHKRRSA